MKAFILRFCTVIAISVAIPAAAMHGSVAKRAKLTPVAETYKVNILADARPFMWEEGGVARGPDADFIREIGKRSGIHFQIDTMPMKRSLNLLKKGKAHFGVGFRTEEREKFVEYIEYSPLHWSMYRVFVKHGSALHYRTVKDLYGMRIGKNRGFAISRHFDDAEKESKIQVLEFDSYEALVRALLEGRVEAIVGNPFAIRKYNSALIHVVPIYAQEEPVSPLKGSYFMMSKNALFEDRVALRSRIESAMKEILNDGTMEKIEQRYPNFVFLPEGEGIATHVLKNSSEKN